MVDITKNPIAAPDGGVAIDVPQFPASTFNISTTPTEFCMLVSTIAPGISSGELAFGMKGQCMLTMSPQAAKELVVLLRDMVAKYEKEYGLELRTPFLADREKA